MIRFEHIDGKIEVASYSPSASLRDLWEAVEGERVRGPLKTRQCRGCGVCCSDLIPVLGLDLELFRNELGLENLALPQRPDLQERQRGIEHLARDLGASIEESAVLYEFNQADPITPVRRQDGSCLFLQKGLCTIYPSRFFICRLYVCTMGDRFATLQEMIVTQGTWDAYVRMGWLAEKEVPHNPFIGARSYEDVAISAFDSLGPQSAEKLFFFY